MPDDPRRSDGPRAVSRRFQGPPPAGRRNRGTPAVPGRGGAAGAGGAYEARGHRRGEPAREVPRGKVRGGEASRGEVPHRAVRRKLLSQNFLIDRRVIQSLAAGSQAGPGDLVLDIGAGNGLITEAVRQRGARVTAIERDPVLARRLRARFGGDPDVTVAESDFLTTPLPREPFGVVANLPFGITTKILRHLLTDPAGALRRADVIVQAEVARKRGTRGRGTLLNACWEPWFEFRAGQRIPRSAFRPQPRVEAAVLTVLRRDHPLLSREQQRDYELFVTTAFTGARPTVASALATVIPRSRFAGLATALGFLPGALPAQLGVEHWVGLFLAAGGAAQRPGGRPHRAGSRPRRARP